LQPAIDVQGFLPAGLECGAAPAAAERLPPKTISHGVGSLGSYLLTPCLLLVSPGLFGNLSNRGNFTCIQKEHCSMSILGNIFARLMGRAAAATPGDAPASGATPVVSPGASPSWT
jgi:hypothetical protein